MRKLPCGVIWLFAAHCPDTGAMTFEILVVCTGNICRSPVAAQLLAAGLDRGGVRVTSAGVGAVVGSDIGEGMMDALGRAGVSAGPHEARQATEALISGADLVLTMDTDQRSWILGRVPAALRRTYTLREFALICGFLSGSGEVNWPARLDDESRLEILMDLAGMQRGRFRAGPGLVIDDPYRGAPEDYDRALAEIQAAVGQIIAAVEGKSAEI